MTGAALTTEQSSVRVNRPAAPAIRHPRRWAIFGTVAIGVFMATLDGSIVNIALPTLSRALGASPALIEWVVLAYLLIVTGTLLLLGRLADLVGRKPIYTAGFAIFTLGSLLCGLAPAAAWLIAARVVQGVGAAMLFAIGPALIADVFGPEERGKALGLIGTTVAVGSSVGPLLGGVLLSITGWPVIFLINVPIGLLAIVLSRRLLPDPAGQTRQSFDVGGALLFFVSVTALVLALSLGPDEGWSSGLVLGLGTAGVAGLALFTWWEARHASPMLDLSIFRNRLFTVSLMASFLSFVALSANFLILPFYLAVVLGLPSWQVGLTLLASAATLSVVAPVGGTLSDRFGPRWPSLVGLAILAAGLLLLAGLATDWRPPDIAWRIALLGLGGGLFQSPNSSAIFAALPPQRRGVGSSLLAFARNLGLATGTALGAALWLTGRLAAAGARGIPLDSPAAQVAGMHLAYLVVGGLIGAAILLVALRGPATQPVREEMRRVESRSNI